MRLRDSGKLTSGGRAARGGRAQPGNSHAVHVTQPRQQETIPWWRMPRSTVMGQPHHGQRMFIGIL